MERKKEGKTEWLMMVRFMSPNRFMAMDPNNPISFGPKRPSLAIVESRPPISFPLILLHNSTVGCFEQEFNSWWLDDGIHDQQNFAHLKLCDGF